MFTVNRGSIQDDNDALGTALAHDGTLSHEEGNKLCRWCDCLNV